MILLEAKWIGLEGLAEQELNALRKPIEKAITKAQLHFEMAVKKKLTGSRTGRIYRLGRKGKVYQASAPGEAPALVRGQLRQSITHGPVVWEGDEASGDVGTAAKQAAIMEYGGIGGGGSRILPRPYMASTFLEEETNLQNILSEVTRV